jgi:ribosomal protein L37AE/L43A
MGISIRKNISLTRCSASTCTRCNTTQVQRGKRTTKVDLWKCKDKGMKFKGPRLLLKKIFQPWGMKKAEGACNLGV